MIRNVGKRLLSGIVKVIAGLALALFLFTHQSREPDATTEPTTEAEPGVETEP